MDFHLPMPKVPLLVVAMGAMVLSTGAQQSGQSIIFSVPQNDEAQSVTPSLAPPTPPLPSLPSTLQAPVSPFSYNPPNNFAALSPPAANVSEQQRMKKLLDDRKNWPLMTPEEIFGASAGKSLQPEEDEATKQKTNQTQLERYLDRENQSLAGRTNGWQSDRGNLPWDLAHGRDRTDLSDYRRNDTKEVAQNFDRFLNSQRNDDFSANQNENAGWDSFSLPAPPAPPKPNAEQLAAMERFRQLLEPNPAPASPQSAFFPAPKAVAYPNFAPPAFASFTPLNNGIGKPAGFTPLPGITPPGSQPAAIPAWTPQPPPWVSQAPQPFAAPQWKF